LLLVACGSHADPIDTPDAAAVDDDLSGYPTIGPRGQVGFALEFGTADRAIAQRATAFGFGKVKESAPALVAVTSDDENVVTADQLTPAAGHTFTIRLRGAGAGDTDLVFRNVDGIEIDRVRLHVRATDTLAIDRPWGAGDALVLAGEVERLHVTTVTAGEVTVGTGAADFVLTGALTTAAAADAPWFFGEGDQTYFRAASAGAGKITAQAPNTTTDVTVAIVAPAALTAITVSAASVSFAAGHEGNVTIGATAGSAPVYGVRCAWAAPVGLTIKLESLYGDLQNLGLQTGWVGSTPSFVYSFTGSQGTYQAVCTLPGGLSTTINVQIN
jgi:hypothetical protein